MKPTFLYCLLAAIATAPCGAPIVLAKSTIDHLVPIDAKVNEPEYDRLWAAKLLVTPGDLARLVVLPGTSGEEAAVSVYALPARAAPTEYRVTLTRATSSLWDAMQTRERDRARRISILRFDAPLSEDAAFAVRDAWINMLGRTRPESRRGEVYIDSTTKIFSAVGRRGVVTAEMPKGEATGNLAELSAIGGSLMEFATMPATLRAQKEREIYRAAIALLRRIEK